MPQYRKKPVVIEARQVVSYLDFEDIARWVKDNGGAMVYGQEDPGPVMGYINTLEGNHEVRVGDWIIQGVAGEFYPCKPNIFLATYELAEA